MEFMTLLYLAMLAVGGVTLDVYQNPQTLEVQVVAPGGNLEPSVDRSFIALVVQEELNRVARLNSMLAHPAIKSADDKDLVETLAESLGGAELVTALSTELAEAPSTLKFALYNDNAKLTMYVSGRSKTPDFGDERFDLAIRQRDGETPVELMKRASIEAAAHIDPYLAMLYMIQKGNETGNQAYFDEAMTVVDRFRARYPAGRYMLLARLTNLAGIIQVGRGDYAGAQASFAAVRQRLPAGDMGPTFALSGLNEAFATIALGQFDAARAKLDGLLAATNRMENLLGYRSVSTEGVEFYMQRLEVDRLLVTACQLQGAAALGAGNDKLAEEWLALALRIEPNRVTARWLQANLLDRRGDRAAADALRASILELKPKAKPFLENATAWSSLYFGADKVTVLPSLYLPGGLPETPRG